jgi:hypothetical protein
MTILLSREISLHTNTHTHIFLCELVVNNWKEQEKVNMHKLKLEIGVIVLLPKEKH